MDILIKIAQLFLCFTILVGLHEFGHFIMARIFKIRVEKFYIFFDPWFSLLKFKRGDTEYGLGWLPLGGYVKIAGMIDESMDTEQMKQPIQPWEFRSKPAWQRFLVMIAGVVMNVLLAFVIYTGICATWGDQYLANEDMKWGYNFTESAEALGLKDGDKIIAIDQEPINNILEINTRLLITDKDREVEIVRNGEPQRLTLTMESLVDLRKKSSGRLFYAPVIPFIIDSIASPEALAAGLKRYDQVVAINDTHSLDASILLTELKRFKGDSVTFSVLRGDDAITLRTKLDTAGNIDDMFMLMPLPTKSVEYTIFEAIPAGIKRCGRMISDYWQQIKMIFQPKTKVYEELGGFISIGSIFSSDWNWLDFWAKCALLSIILAVMNILPIPGLDGGHALFTLWEMITGRKLSDKFLEIAQYIGLILLFALLIYANGNDIYRFFIK